MVFLFTFRFTYTVIQERSSVLPIKGQRGVVEGKSVSHYHCHTGWQRSELGQVYGNSGMMGMDWSTEVYRDTGVAEIEGVKRSIY